MSVDNVEDKILELEREELKALRYSGRKIFNCEYGKKLFASHVSSEKNPWGGTGCKYDYPHSHNQDIKQYILKIAKDFLGLTKVNLNGNVSKEDGEKLELLVNNICKAICDTLDSLKEDAVND